jgi:hypothetical protein
MSGRRNTVATIQASAASTDVTGAWLQNPGYLGGCFTFYVTAQSATAILPTFTVQGRVGGTTKGYNLATLATTAGLDSVARIVIFPGISTASGSTVANPAEYVSQPLPAQFRVKSTNAGSGTVTWAAYVDLIG